MGKYINWKAGSTKIIYVLFSKVWMAFLGILFVPIYIRLIGAEGYGLVSFYGTLYGALVLLDMGLTTSVSRQTTIYKTNSQNEADLKNLVYSAEILNWIIAFLGSFLIFSMSDYIAFNWVNANSLPVSTVRNSVILMGLLFACQFPISIYEGVMIGSNNQVTNATMSLLFITLRGIGVVFLLKWVSPTIECFFIWQVTITFFYAFFMRWYIFKRILSATKASFSISQLNKIKKFAMGIFGVSIASFFLIQIDKIVVSKYLLLDQVAYYNLAFLLTGVINIITFSIQPIVMPKMVQLQREGNYQALSSLYHRCSRWLSIIIAPIGFFFIFFAHQILFVWTRNEALAKAATSVLQFVMGGTMISGLLFVSFYFIQAKGNTKFHIYQYIISAFVSLPLFIIFTKKNGIDGAAIVWFGVHVGYLLLSLPIFHHYYLKGELIKWYLNNVLPPFLTSLTITILVRTFQQSVLPELNVGSLAIFFASIMVLYAIFMPELRNPFIIWVKKYLLNK